MAKALIVPLAKTKELSDCPDFSDATKPGSGNEGWTTS
jgi:hypothetical protein